MKKEFSIAIDPGHPSLFKDGRINFGAVSKDGVKEVEVNLEVAEILKGKLESAGFQVIQTRSGNQKIIGNEQRVKIAADFGANFIIRLHCDQDRHNDCSKNGIRTFYPPEEAEKISQKSKDAAKIIQEEVVVRTGLFDGGIHDDKVGDVDPSVGMFVGSKEANKFGIPTVLVEMVYLSNPDNAKWITFRNNEELLAEALASGVKRIFEEIEFL